MYVGSEGGTTPCSPYIENMYQKNDETSTNEESSKYLQTAHQGIDPSAMKTKRRCKKTNTEGMRWVIRRMSVQRAAQHHALPILKSPTRRRWDINQRNKKQVLTGCGPRYMYRSIDNANDRAGARIRTPKVWGELSVEWRFWGRHNATLSQYWNHEPEDDGT